MLLLRITRNLISWTCLLFDDEQLLYWQNTHQISPGLVNFCWSYYQLQKTNSELLSVTKLKEEQECQWRLEKQVQAHEMQKQKKRYLINIHIIRSPVKWLLVSHDWSRIKTDQSQWTYATWVLQPITWWQNWPVRLHKPDLVHSKDHNHSLDSDDDFCTGCRDICHHYQQQSFSALHYHISFICKEK